MIVLSIKPTNYDISKSRTFSSEQRIKLNSCFKEIVIITETVTIKSDNTSSSTRVQKSQ